MSEEVFYEEFSSVGEFVTMKRCQNLIMIFALTFSFVLIVNAQSSQNTKFGKIIVKLRDCTGDAVSKAKIIIEGGKHKRKLKSDENGEFIILLPEGKYKVLIQKYGFMSYLYSETNVQADLETKIEVKMKFGYATSDPNHDKPFPKPCPTQE